MGTSLTGPIRPQGAPCAPVHSLRELLEREPGAEDVASWAGAYGSDFAGAWLASPRGDWLVIMGMRAGGELARRMYVVAMAALHAIALAPELRTVYLCAVTGVEGEDARAELPADEVARTHRQLADTMRDVVSVALVPRMPFAAPTLRQVLDELLPSDREPEPPAAVVVPFTFEGDTLDVVKRGEDIWLALRRVCEALGLGFGAQTVRLRAKPWATVSMIETVGNDGKSREMLCIHLRSLPMWLATIDEGRVAEHVRSKLAKYQLDCAQVLADHFLGSTPSPLPVPAPPATAPATIDHRAKALDLRERALQVRTLRELARVAPTTAERRALLEDAAAVAFGERVARRGSSRRLPAPGSGDALVGPLLEGWAELQRRLQVPSLTSARALDALYDAAVELPQLRAAIEDLCGCLPGNPPRATSLGHRLRRLEGVTARGLVLSRTTDSHAKVTLWKVSPSA